MYLLLPPSAVFLPQNQMNTVVGHAGGKDQAHVILAIQAIEPSYFSSQKARPPLGLPVFRQWPAANQFLCPQIHDVKVVVIKQEGKNVTEA